MTRERVKAVVTGAVQGVGFRPFLFRLANEMKLSGGVRNSTKGVSIEVEGARGRILEFLRRLKSEKPAHALIDTLDFVSTPTVGDNGFVIYESSTDGQKSAFVLPDLAACGACLRDILSPANRRYRYPFTNCTHCGPRFSIIEALPYDRANTSMRGFRMCSECEREYHDPNDRRFHAQPNACPACGPRLELWKASGRVVAEQHQALVQAAAAVRRGQIVALKGIGGFQLLVDARNESAVAQLRKRKQREEKPFAVMFPTLPAARLECCVDAVEEHLLTSIQAPIVLLKRRPRRSGFASRIACAVAPHNPCLGVILPYSPLHHLLLRALNFPVVATSGNLSDEPICIDEQEALERLHGIADVLLVHNRPIVRHVDDSVVRVALGREMVLRRARGYAPLPVSGCLQGIDESQQPDNVSILAFGGHLKNTVALSVNRSVFVSQHIGDLETHQANAAFRKIAADLPALYDAKPDFAACDLHPDYVSSQCARRLGAPVVAVQHHYAHVLACMAENRLMPPVLGVAWDGTGLGTDGTIWGGEFLLVNDEGFKRVAHLRTFPLPGGEAAVRQPRRAALGLLYELFGEKILNHSDLLPFRGFSKGDLNLLRSMLRRKLNAPLTSSAGRIFDAVASLIGLRQVSSFEGQAATDLEFAASAKTSGCYPFALGAGETESIDWRPMVRAILRDLERNEPIGIIAAKFHSTLAELIAGVALRFGEPNIVLTGGCFQNLILLERTVHRLRARGFHPCWHHRIPPNDGGVAVGQVVAAQHLINRQTAARASCAA